MNGQANPGPYDQKFYAFIAPGSYAAAQVFLPVVRRHYAFNSVCDVGCGAATWLRAAGECIGPAARLTGIDGEYARTIVNCPGAEFVFQDLEKPIAGVARHDLVMSLEVAEHLSAARAASFVDDLCRISDVALFAAAIVHQGGAGHVNEQPQSYWLEHFRRNGYSAYDVHRAELWRHPVFTNCAWYVGNSFLYIRDGHALADKLADYRLSERDLVDVVHPDLLRGWAEAGFRISVINTFGALRRAIVRRLRRS